MRGDALILRGDALNLPLPDDSVDLVVTSPPYFALRSYRDDGEHYEGQLGSEPTPAAFVDALLAATQEMARVLKPTGSAFVNLGDKYAGSGGHNNAGIARKAEANGQGPKATRRQSPDRYNQESDGVRAKSLIGLPWRYAIRCVDELGLILRAEIVWDKPNGIPESPPDRVRRSHEQWFHFTTEGRYYSATDEIREASETAATDRRSDPQNYADNRGSWHDHENDAEAGNHQGTKTITFNPLGKLPGSVWRVPSQKLDIPKRDRERLGLTDHFAAFPLEWPRRLILGWSPSGICLECGTGRFPVAPHDYVNDSTVDGRPAIGNDAKNREASEPGTWGMPERTRRVARIEGYACACTPSEQHEEEFERKDGTTGTRRFTTYTWDGWTPPETRPAVVLDPFGGTGTVALVARELGRIGISVDLSADYCRLARWRVFESGHGAKAVERTWHERQEALL